MNSHLIASDADEWDSIPSSKNMFETYKQVSYMNQIWCMDINMVFIWMSSVAR
jgi:hypothetical protein